MCAAKIAAERGQELERLVTWAQHEGHTVAMMTLTARHNASMNTGQVWDGVANGWSRVINWWGSETERGYQRRVEANQEAWNRYLAGQARRRPKSPEDVKPRRIGIRERAGVLGYVRATEVTYGVNGPHVHFHVILILDREVMPRKWADQQVVLDRFRAEVYPLWTRGLAQSNMTAVEQSWPEIMPDGSVVVKNVGIDIRIIHGIHDIALYLTKMGDAEAAVKSAQMKRESEGLSVEVASGAFKKGRRGSRSPFEVLADVETLGLVDDAELWGEWVRASRGRRQLVWSDGLRALAGLDEDERTDEEIAAEEIGTVDVLVVDKRTWSEDLRSTDLRLAILALMEASGPNAVASFFDDHGVRYWRCDEEGEPIAHADGLLPRDLARKSVLGSL